jgi:hypothetical protein
MYKFERLEKVRCSEADYTIVLLYQPGTPDLPYYSYDHDPFPTATQILKEIFKKSNITLTMIST